MNITEFQRKRMHWRVPIVTSWLAIIVGALVLQAAAAANVGPLAALSAIPTAAGQRTPYLLGVGFRSVGNVQNTSPLIIPEQFHYVAAVMANSSESRPGVPLVDCWQSRPLIERIGMTRNEFLSELEKYVIEGDRLQVWFGRDGRQVRRLFSKGIIDPYIIDFIKNRVNGAKRQMAFSGTPFLPPRLYQGNFPFGKTLDNKEIITKTEWFNAHSLIVGGTGSGKTNLSKMHAIFIAPHVKGYWLVDIRKTEYRKLRSVFAQMGLDLKIIRGRKFRINPLQVPMGVEPIEYASIISEALLRVLNLPPRSSTLLRTTIIRLYAKQGIFNDGMEFPTFFDLYTAIKENRNANPQARQAALDSLEALLLSLGPEVLAYHQGWNVHELAQQHLVFELAGLPEMGKDLILTYLLTAVFTSCIYQGISNPGMDLWITFDEAQRIFSCRRESNSYGGNPLVDLTGLIRGTGIGLEISALTTVDLSPSLPNMTATKIVGRCGSISEYTTAGKFVGLNDDQTDWASHTLIPGRFIGQVGEGNWRYPFVFCVPLIKELKISSTKDPTDDTVTDDQADQSARKVVASRVISQKSISKGVIDG